LVFVPAPGLQVHRFLFPVLELYQLIHEPHLQSELGAQARQELLKYVKAEVTKVLNSDSGDAIKNDELRSLVLWRPEYKAQFEYVSEAEADVIRKIKTQSSVDAIIEHIGSHNIDLLTWLTKAISNKFIFAVA